MRELIHFQKALTVARLGKSEEIRFCLIEKFECIVLADEGAQFHLLAGADEFARKIFF